MVDITRHTAPKSDQMNADDLIGGPRTITITDVREMGSSDQPIAIYFEGDQGKPYKPCKSMMRALAFVWGPEGDDYVGRSMTLYNDPTVTFGPDTTGGIRISHMSHIPEPMEFPLTAKRGKRRLYRVEPLQTPKPRRTLADAVAGYEAAVAKCETTEALAELQTGEGAEKLKAALNNAGTDEAAQLLERMTTAGSKRYNELSSSSDDEGGEDESQGETSEELDDDPFAGAE